MSLECSECERDLRGPHDEACSRYNPNPCPATREAVRELEDEGHIGCLICGKGSSYHEPESTLSQEENEG